VTAGVLAGQEFIGAWGRSRVPSRLEHSAGPARYTFPLKIIQEGSI
jgi:hypothetical protein